MRGPSEAPYEYYLALPSGLRMAPHPRDHVSQPSRIGQGTSFSTHSQVLELHFPPPQGYSWPFWKKWLNEGSTSVNTSSAALSATNGPEIQLTATLFASGEMMQGPISVRRLATHWQVLDPVKLYVTHGFPCRTTLIVRIQGLQAYLMPTLSSERLSRRQSPTNRLSL